MYFSESILQFCKTFAQIADFAHRGADLDGLRTPAGHVLDPSVAVERAGPGASRARHGGSRDPGYPQGTPPPHRGIFKAEHASTLASSSGGVGSVSKLNKIDFRITFFVSVSHLLLYSPSSAVD